MNATLIDSSILSRALLLETTNTRGRVMHDIPCPRRPAVVRTLIVLLALVWGSSIAAHTAVAQETNGTEPGAEEAADPLAMAEAALATEEQPEAQTEGELPAPQDMATKINLLALLIRGGWLMWPILAMSLLVVTFGVERLLGLRRRKVLPPNLVNDLGLLGSQKGGLDPRKAYRLCQQHPSTAASVIRAMLLKVGRPHTELEHAVAEANEREAARLYTNVRWLSLAAGVTPLLGLLGTVWGMIQAFFATANLPVGANKAEYLAEGIYVALVTTFAGLAVAIPAAVLAHIFEGRIQTLFRELDEMLLGLLPQLERFEGRLRVSREHFDGAGAGAPDGPPPLRSQPATAPK
jgi:biopolymer transport protein ExbB